MRTSSQPHAFTVPEGMIELRVEVSFLAQLPGKAGKEVAVSTH